MWCPGATSPYGSRPTKPGEYHLFCAEYCGTEHSGMIGWVIVMEPRDYQPWLAAAAPRGRWRPTGEKLFINSAAPAATLRRPGPCSDAARACYNRPRELDGGSPSGRRCLPSESILDPNAKSSKAIEADHAHVPRAAHRGGDHGADRLYQVAQTSAGRSKGDLDSGRVTLPVTRIQPEHRQTNEMTANGTLDRPTHGTGIISTPDSASDRWLLTTDHKRIAMLYMISITFSSSSAASRRALMRIELLTPDGDLRRRRDLQQALHHARHHHGLVLPDPFDPRHSRQFSGPAHDWRARIWPFRELNLLSWYLFMTGGAFTLFAIICGGVDTGWTFYTPYSSTYSNTYVMADGRSASSSPASPRS